MTGIIKFLLATLGFLLIIFIWMIPLLLTWKYDNKIFLWIYIVYYMILRVLYKIATK